MGRAERRKVMREQQNKIMSMERMTAKMREVEMCKNGITERDLQEKYAAGYNDGAQKARSEAVTTAYASVCLACQELFGFDKKQCYDMLNKSFNLVLYSLTDEELVREAFGRIGLDVTLHDLLEPVSILEGE